MSTFRSLECLELAAKLQQQATRRGQESAVSELMRFTVEHAQSDEMILGMCRLLFVPRCQSAFRSPRMGKPWLLGNTTESVWSAIPVHLHHDVPFYVVRGWTLAGSAEPISWYLAYCLLNGAWNEIQIHVPSQDLLRNAARDFIVHGPWESPLDSVEQRFILAQSEENRLQGNSDVITE